MKTDSPEQGHGTATFTLSPEDQLTLNRLFRETCHEDLQLLEQAVQEARFEQVLHRVHRLHGAALTVGAAPLVAILAEFETALRAGGPVPVDPAGRLARLSQALEQYLRR